MISKTAEVKTSEFERQTGWVFKPEGACKGERCVPFEQPRAETVTLSEVADRLHMPIVHDGAAGLWCLGPESGGRALTSAEAPDIELPDWRGEVLRLRSLRGQKVLLIAWASW